MTFAREAGGHRLLPTAIAERDVYGSLNGFMETNHVATVDDDRAHKLIELLSVILHSVAQLPGPGNQTSTARGPGAIAMTDVYALLLGKPSAGPGQSVCPHIMHTNLAHILNRSN